MGILRRIVVVGLAAVAACSGPLTTGDTTLAETVIDMSDALVAVREETALLQAHGFTARAGGASGHRRSETPHGGIEPEIVEVVG